MCQLYGFLYDAEFFMQVDCMSISLWHTPELTMSTCTIIYSEFDLNIKSWTQIILLM